VGIHRCVRTGRSDLLAHLVGHFLFGVTVTVRDRLCVIPDVRDVASGQMVTECLRA
jgi:hypothetical protein